MFRVAAAVFLWSAAASAAFDARWELYGSGTAQQWNKRAPWNAGNQILKVPDASGVVELRPDLSLRGSAHELVIRSRHFGLWQTRTFTPAGGTEQSETIGEGHNDLSDFYWSAVWHDKFSTTIGLQNYQWGPAEIFSPSNPFFHFATDQRSFFYKEKGLVLARANWNPNSRWSVAALGEPTDNRARPWVDDPAFRSRGALKVDYQFANPLNALSLVVSQTGSGKAFVGETVSVAPAEGFSLYLDARHSPGDEGYRPTRNAFGLYDLQIDDDPADTEWRTLAVAGFRWEGRVDFRQEFIWNGYGYTDLEWDNARAAATTLSPNLARNLERFFRPGLEFRRQAYSYTSLRVPDLGKGGDISVAVRWLAGLRENSSLLQFSYEQNLTDRLVASGEGIWLLGDERGEFRLAADSQVSAGFRFTF